MELPPAPDERRDRRDPSRCAPGPCRRRPVRRPERAHGRRQGDHHASRDQRCWSVRWRDSAEVCDPVLIAAGDVPRHARRSPLRRRRRAWSRTPRRPRRRAASITAPTARGRCRRPSVDRSAPDAGARRRDRRRDVAVCETEPRHSSRCTRCTRRPCSPPPRLRSHGPDRSLRGLIERLERGAFAESEWRAAGYRGQLRPQHQHPRRPRRDQSAPSPMSDRTTDAASSSASVCETPDSTAP